MNAAGGGEGAAVPATRCGRREFCRGLMAACLRLPLLHAQTAGDVKARVGLVRSGDRSAAVEKLFKSIGPAGLDAGQVYLKADYGNPNRHPATTHPDTLSALVRALRRRGAGSVTLVERSGMGRTRAVWEGLGVPKLARELGMELLALEDLERGAWARVQPEQSHWSRGFEVPRFLRSGAVLVQAGTLKTHRFGAQFSGGLENSLGLIAKHAGDDPAYNYLEELHGSEHQTRMIAEVASVFNPVITLLDASEVFIDGGPEAGDVATPGVMLASADRVALDAAGVALLVSSGAGFPLAGGAVFGRGQIARAVELELGISSASEIAFAPEDRASELVALQLEGILAFEAQGEKEKPGAAL